MHLRIYYTQQGGHIHCRVYSAKAKNFTHAKNGTLVFTEEEWQTVFDMLNPARGDDRGGAAGLIVRATTPKTRPSPPPDGSQPAHIGGHDEHAA